MAFNIDSLPLKVVRSQRKTLSIELKMDGILVRAPEKMSMNEIRTYLYKKDHWIESHWNAMQERNNCLEQTDPFSRDEIQALAEKACSIIPQKVEYYARQIGVDYGRITIRCQKTRWGSCTSKGNLNFNCLLMLFPDDVIDSVVVHELCHRKQMNHSAAFYAEVEKVFPEYKRCRKWLKEHGGAYLRRLPQRGNALQY